VAWGGSSGKRWPVVFFEEGPLSSFTQFPVEPIQVLVALVLVALVLVALNEEILNDFVHRIDLARWRDLAALARSPNTSHFPREDVRARPGLCL
jgi:hypothetical protein